MTALHSRLARLVLVCTTLLAAATVPAQTVNLAQAPLLTAKVAPGLVMLIMGRDLTLSRAAFNDVNDIDGDGVMDTYFKPSFKYDGYFASDRCYNYNATNGRFEPKGLTTGTAYQCSGTGTSSATNPRWSGNFLNWTSMSRIDVIRKVLYGGKRSTDDGSATSTDTVLERAYVPQDSTLWGKEYESVTRDGYDIKYYAPLTAPSAGLRHIFANVTGAGPTTGYYLATTNAPMLLVYQSSSYRVWDIVAANKPILGMTFNSPVAATNQYVVRVQTCVKLGTNSYESWCAGYPWGATTPTNYKPIGVLQKYGHSNTLAFGLISGSYDNNYGGGVLRKNVDDINGEIDTTGYGTFNASAYGIIYHLSTLRPWGFGVDPSDSQSPVWSCKDRYVSQRQNGECMAWGNPLGEMMYEGLNYFAGGPATPAFTSGVGVSPRTLPTEQVLSTDASKIDYSSPEGTSYLNLRQPNWANPYKEDSSRLRKKAYPTCARPSHIVVGNPSTTFDSDQLPGTSFSISPAYGQPVTQNLGSMNVSDLATSIFKDEFGSTPQTFFIGESGANIDGNPSAKSVTTFANIRGHAPDDTTGQGSFYGAAVARYGKSIGVANPQLTDPLKVNTFSVALDSHIPKIKIAMNNNGSFVSIVPFSKTVGGPSQRPLGNITLPNPYVKGIDYWGATAISAVKGDWQPTGAITAFFIDSLYNIPGMSNSNLLINSGRPQYNFRLSYSDSDQGGDNETDAIVTYQINVLSDTTLSIKVAYVGGSNFAEMHQGYAISGTTADGVYLETGGNESFNKHFPASVRPAEIAYFLDTGYPAKLPVTMASPRVFTVGTSNASYVPHDMLWYAAKYGSANYKSNNVLDSVSLKANGDPESYFFASNPSLLSDQIGQAFQKAAALSAATTSAGSTEGSKVVGNSFAYTPRFETLRWGGDVLAQAIDANAQVSGTPTWFASQRQPAPASRNLVLGRGGASTFAVTPASYSSLTAAEQISFKDDSRFRFLMGERNLEKQNNGSLRDRNSALGDIVNADALYVGKADFGYGDTSYQTFKAAADPKLVVFGSNDGFFRLIAAAKSPDTTSAGAEKLAFMPQGALTNIAKLADPYYTHQYYVDGPTAFGHVLNGGTWRSVVAGSLGAGGKSVFAVDTGKTETDTPAVLWEYKSNDLGNVLSKPIVGQLENNQGVVIVGNGVNSTNGKATLLILDAKAGTLVRSCTPTKAANVTANGMTSIEFISTNNNGKISYIYAADIVGNVWRIDPNSTSCSTGAVPIFTASSPDGKAQAITGGLSVIPGPTNKGGYMVLLGTGSYNSQADATNTTTQSLYGIWDDTTSIVTNTRASLLPQAISSTGSGTRTTSVSADIGTGKAWFDMTGKQGWMMDLAGCVSPCGASERHIATPLVQKVYNTQTASFLTLVPGNDECSPGGAAWLTVVDPISGDAAKQMTALSSANSTYIPSSTGKGVNAAPKSSTKAEPGAIALLISGGFTNGTPAAFQGGSWTGVYANADGAGTAYARIDFGVPPPVTAKRLHRQVWRQLQ